MQLKTNGSWAELVTEDAVNERQAVQNEEQEDQ